MGKVVNSTYTVTRNGLSKSTPMKALPYGRLVAVEVALAGAMVSLCLPAVQDVVYAAHPVGKKPPKSGGDQNIALELTTDHGGGGSSEFRIEYRGVSHLEADEIERTVYGAIQAALA